MSRQPFLDYHTRDGFRIGHREVIDGTQSMLTDPWSRVVMGVTDETVAERYGISLEEQDAFALESSGSIPLTTHDRSRRRGLIARLSAYGRAVVDTGGVSGRHQTALAEHRRLARFSAVTSGRTCSSCRKTVWCSEPEPARFFPRSSRCRSPQLCASGFLRSQRRSSRRA